MSTATARQTAHAAQSSSTTGSLAREGVQLATPAGRGRRDDPLPLSRDLTVQPARSASSSTAEPGDKPLVEAARELWRQVAGAAPDEEATALYEERRALLARANAGTATRPEKNRLALVRWHLERIEDAKHGESLDKLEALGRLYARMADRVRDVVGELERVNAR